jgi:pSer/pThr/pTyr-binding forkhead associated (FHA) protein
VSIATAFIPRVARIALVPVQTGPMQYPRQIDNDLTLIGTGDVCDVCLTSDKIAAVHAALIRIGPTVYLCDLGSPSGTSLNDERIRSARITQGSIISIGPSDFRVELVGDAPPEAPIPSFKLHCAQTSASTSSQDGLILIGCDPACDLVLTDPTIAPRHVVVAWTTHGPMVRDLVGGYSIRRNGGRTGAGVLNNGDKIGIGPFELKFETEHPLRPHRAASELSLSGPELLSPMKLLTPRETVPAESRIPFKSSFKSLTGGLDFSKPRISRAVEPAIKQRPAKIEKDESTLADSMVSARLKQIDDSSQRFKARVAAAQQALDERARKLWEGLSKERERLTTYHSELHQKARQLLETAMGKNQNAPAKADVAEKPHPKAESPVDKKQENLVRVFGGEFEPAAATQRNADETARAAQAAEPKPRSPTPEQKSLDHDVQEHAARLAELVHRERQEMDTAEARLEGLRFEIERLKSVVSRGSERHVVRQAELDSRMENLRRAQQTLEVEHDALTSKVRRLEAKQAALKTRVGESQQQRTLLDDEARQIAQSRELLEQRRVDLRTTLESERQRLSLRQAELQDKAAELARIARERRESIEARVLQEQAALEEHEKQIRAQRQALEEASRGELDRTATELEQVLNARLSDIETEINTRQTDLNKWMQVLSGHESASVPDVQDQPASASSDDNTAPLDFIPAEVEQESNRLSALQKEIGELQDAIHGIGDEGLSDTTDTLVSRSLNGNRRWSSTMKSRLSEKIANLRTTTVVATKHRETEPIPLSGEAAVDTVETGQT